MEYTVSRDSTLFLKPTLTSDRFGEDFIMTGQFDLWGGQPGDVCTNPQVQSLISTAQGFVEPLQYT